MPDGVTAELPGILGFRELDGLDRYRDEIHHGGGAAADHQVGGRGAAAGPLGDPGTPVARLARQFKVSRATIYRYISLANPEQLRQTTSSETAVSNCT